VHPNAGCSGEVSPVVYQDSSRTSGDARSNIGNFEEFAGGEVPLANLD
jgi:hypothetical protein